MKAFEYLLAAGPLVALLNRRDQHHAWARSTLDALNGPVITCEAVLSEAWFLARRGGGDPLRVLELVHALDADIVRGWGARAEKILYRYTERASVADVVLLALVEAEENRIIVTTDRDDFSVYRLPRRRTVPTIMPPA